MKLYLKLRVYRQTCRKIPDIWIFVEQRLEGQTGRFWPQRYGPVEPDSNGKWKTYGYISERDAGDNFGIVAVAVHDEEASVYIDNYVHAVTDAICNEETPPFFLDFPPLVGFIADHKISVRMTTNPKPAVIGVPTEIPFICFTKQPTVESTLSIPLTQPSTIVPSTSIPPTPTLCWLPGNCQ